MLRYECHLKACLNQLVDYSNQKRFEKASEDMNRIGILEYRAGKLVFESKKTNRMLSAFEQSKSLVEV